MYGQGDLELLFASNGFEEQNGFLSGLVFEEACDGGEFRCKSRSFLGSIAMYGFILENSDDVTGTIYAHNILLSI